MAQGRHNTPDYRGQCSCSLGKERERRDTFNRIVVVDLTWGVQRKSMNCIFRTAFEELFQMKERKRNKFYRYIVPSVYNTCSIFSSFRYKSFSFKGITPFSIPTTISLKSCLLPLLTVRADVSCTLHKGSRKTGTHHSLLLLSSNSQYKNSHFYGQNYIYTTLLKQHLIIGISC